MSMIRKENMKDIIERATFYLQNKLKMTTKNALGVSLFLHVALGLAVAAIYGEQLPSLLSSKKNSKIKFELVAVDKIEKQTSNNASYDNKQASSAAKKTGKLVGLKTSTSKKIVAENVTMNKESAMLASLASLTELKEVFSFVVQEISADSSGVFAPIQGDAPDTKVIADGLINGYGYGGRTGIISLGGGDGKCPPRPRPRP